jgi:hypothetical protein
MADRNSTPNPATLADEQVIALIRAKLAGLTEDERRAVRAYMDGLIAKRGRAE